jgi:photosystem II stability/assembly factor-like uncharacterized protein
VSNRALRRIGLAAIMVAVCIALAGCARDVNRASEVPKPGPPLPSRPGATVWGVGIENIVLASHDGGATWTVQHREPLTEQSLPLLWNVAFGDARHGWAADRTLGVRSEMTLLATTDGGVSWEPQQLGALASTFDVVATDARHVWALGERHDAEPWASLLMATTDGGKSWQKEHVTTRGELSDIAFSDARHGWAVADVISYGVSLVYSTADGGRHWRLRHIARDIVLRRLATSDARHCWLVGMASHGAVQPGEIVATSDGGGHWTTQVSDASAGFDDVAFTDARHGWAVGLGGLILATSNGGATWVRQPTGRSYNLTAVAFSDVTHGFALIGHLAMLATIDGGKTWTVVTPLGKSDDLLCGVACYGP